MRHYHFLSTAVALLFATCFSLHAQQPSEPNELLTDADELMTAVMAKLFDQNGSRTNSSDSQRFQWSDKYERGAAKGTGNTTIWPQGFGLATLAQMAKATSGTDRYDAYLEAATRLAGKFPNYITTINNVRGYSVYGGTQHRFLDDNAWAALGLLDLYEVDPKASYLTAIKMVANYMVKAGRLLEANPPGGGGMYWQDSPADDTNTYKTKNTANNGPAVVIFCRLYEITGDESYLNYAKMTYKWLYNTLLDRSSWLMWDALNVVTGDINKYQAPYTTGSMLHAASLLYSITEDRAYKQTADKIAEAAYRRWFENYPSEALGQTIKLVKTENNTHSDDVVVMLRGYEAYAKISENHRYLRAFAQSLRQIWATRRDAETGLMNYDWKGTATQDTWTSLGQTGYVEMFARMAQLEAAGLVPGADTWVPTVIEAENATRSSGVTTETDSRCSGGKRVGYLGNGKTISFNYDAEEEGLYELTTYYMTVGARDLEVTVNGTDRYAFSCPSSGSWDGANIGNTFVDVKLKAGRNTFVVGNASGNAPNIDKFELLYVGQPEPESGPDPEEPIIATAEATSPDGVLAVLLECNAAGVVTYSVTRAGTPLVSRSRLGFEGRTTFPGGIGEHSVAELQEPYDQLHGKTSHSENHYTLLQAELLGSSEGEKLTVEFRLYDGGVAFRYVMPSGNLTTFSGEVTEFNFESFKQVLALEYRHQYSWYYGQYTWEQMTSDRGYCEPVLVQRSDDDICILLTEAANYGETCANSVIRGDEPGSLRLTGANKTNNNATSNIKYPFTTAWRTLIIGSIKEIVESNMVNDLNPESVVEDLSWIRPGRVAWNWAGEDRTNTGDINVAKRYVDLAAHLGWEYVLIDEGWEGKFTLESFVPYAQQKGVDVIVWYHNNKFSSNYGSCLTKMKQLSSVGVKGVKIDFFDDDAQSVIQKYETLLRAAKESRIMVDFHGCTRPTGWERKYPNLMTMEAVLGGEFLLDQPHMNQADHSANVAVTRNVIGSMDFTPTKLAQRTGSLKTHSNTNENPYTTWSYQLALWTLFESGFQCLIDCPDNIIDSPIEPVLRTIPTAWDETRCIEAVPAQYTTIARRSGTDWYVASISKAARTLRMPLDFLPEGQTYYAYIYRDGPSSQFDIGFQQREVTSSTSLSITIKANGGTTIILSTDPNLPVIKTVSYEAENATGGTSAENVHCSKGKYKTKIENTNALQFKSVNADVAGEYALTLYFMLPEESRSAYIQVGDEGEKLYYDFHQRDDYDRSKGLVMGMKTIYVQLQAGNNLIYYGNGNGTAPDLDKITVTPTWATQQLPTDAVEAPRTDNDNPIATLTISGATANISTISAGRLHLYAPDGRLLYTTDVAAGNSQVSLQAWHGPVIVSFATGTHAFARKALLP